VAARPLLGAGSTYWLLLAVVCALLVIGLVMVLSASSVAALAKQGDSYAYFKRQLLWVASGVVVMVVVSRIDYRLWRRLGTPLLVMATAGLVYVLVHPAAVSAYGSTRWISIGGGLTVQPAEFAKLALLLFSADVLTRKARLLGDVRHLLVPVLPLTLLLAALVMLEPDLGTTLLLCAIAFGMLFVAGAPLLLLGGVGSLGLAAGMGLILSAPYRRTRFFSFMDPGRRPPERRLPVHPGAPGPRLGRAARGRAGRRPAEVVLCAQRPHRLHLRHHRRGAGPARHPVDPAAVRRLRLRRGPGRPARPRPVRPLPGRRGHRLDRRSRPWSTSAPWSACCRSPGCRCRWSPSAAPACWCCWPPPACC
jgi:hypothetical protein